MSKETGEIFFSIDIETDGPIPVRNSMLSFACVAFSPDGTVLGKFERNLKPLPGAVQDHKTMTEFWAREPEAWAYCTSNTVEPELALREFREWVLSMPAGQRVAVCMPSGFDFTFMYVYMMMFAGESPFSFSCIDMKTYVCAARKQAYRNSGKKSWPARWFDHGLPHTHKAIDDAIEQGLTFLKMRAENLNGIESLKAVSANFWNSIGGKPGTIFEYHDGQGKVKIGNDILPFPKKAFDRDYAEILQMMEAKGVPLTERTQASMEPQAGASVRVMFSADGSVFAVKTTHA